MNKSPAFQFYPDKWQSHTSHLTDSAYRVFHEMICWMWQHSDDLCSITSDPAFIAIALRMQCDRITTALTEIQNPHMPLLRESDGRYISNGLRKEAVKQEGRRKKASDAANSRWHKDLDAVPKHSGSNADASSEHSTLSLSPSPIPSLSPTPDSVPPPATKIPPRSPKGDLDYSDDFEQWWKTYPKKKAKPMANKAWKRITDRPPLLALIDAVEDQKTWKDWTKDDGLYIPHGSTWLNNRRWEDETTEATVETDTFGREIK